ncbi:hypothetical protein TREMEDRAFT_61006 [Tremella mesenterica DSM 1558]|uniref:uncharacterized protein n=1 Tax=Tremella mesenterica (strain ATCC 24925 / CBS 8224 / DSM 1558 / NBRC 9311 / NRRL Y-6157 / RJB 2259-6 / UBC 559-6) TaxID=578456 RepID=UPI0003F49C4A|nr:uncharacterized protein TREMEDRAFT_61006 [Tremella mesenterica DSM 1558]EIW70502.1 hypothetical protein TREMEDRAFT_61006 [Tremella mesenterica DSM 1558]
MFDHTYEEDGSMGKGGSSGSSISVNTLLEHLHTLKAQADSCLREGQDAEITIRQFPTNFEPEDFIETVTELNTTSTDIITWCEEECDWCLGLIQSEGFGVIFPGKHAKELRTALSELSSQLQDRRVKMREAKGRAIEGGNNTTEEIIVVEHVEKLPSDAGASPSALLADRTGPRRPKRHYSMIMTPSANNMTPLRTPFE